MALAALRYPVAAVEAQYSARHNMNIGGRSAGACLWAITLTDLDVWKQVAMGCRPNNVVESFFVLPFPCLSGCLDRAFFTY